MYIVCSAIVYSLFSEELILWLGKNKALLLYQAASQLTFMLLPTIYLVRFSSDNDSTILSLEQNPSISTYLFSILGWIGIMMISMSLSGVQNFVLPNWVVEYLSELSEGYQESLEALILQASIPLWSLVFVIAFLPAIIEEILFRGYLQFHLRQRLGKLTTYFLVGIIFSLVHFNPLAILGLFVISLYLSHLTERTGSIIPAMLVHFINNTYMLVLYREWYIYDDIPSSSEPEILALLILLITGIAITGFNIYAIEQNNRNKN